MTIQAVIAGQRGRPRKHLDGEELLGRIARHVNQYGAGGLNLSALADDLGMPRKSLYYYCKSRDDLLATLYDAAVSRISGDLADAVAAATSPADAIERFIAASLAYDGKDFVALTDIDFLDSIARETMHTRVAGLTAAIGQVISRGVECEQLRPCDAEIAAHLVMGMINWSRIYADWVGVRDTIAMRGRLCKAVTQLILRGMTDDAGVDITFDVAVESLFPRNYDPFDRDELARMKLEQIAMEASRLFNRRGIGATSLDEVAAAVGMTKPALYNYFSSKDQLISYCYQRSFTMIRRIIEAGEHSESGLRQIGLAIHLNTQSQLGALHTLVPQPGASAIAEGERQKIDQAVSGMITMAFRGYRRAMQDGSARPLDIFATGSAVAGALLWLPKWLREGKDRIAVANEVNTILLHGLLDAGAALKGFLSTNGATIR